MLNIILGFFGTIIVGGISYYYYKNKYNDQVIELLSVVHNDLKIIKYQYRGQKYIYLTDILEEDINKIQTEIDPANTEKD